MIIDEIKIPKGNLNHFFIGGMNYSEDFSFQESRNSYPFSTYYINRVEDVIEDGIRYRSLFYCKLPLICLQFDNRCLCVEFDLPAQVDGSEVFPFVGLQETDKHYKVIFKHFPEIHLKEKESAWLGFGSRRRIQVPGNKPEFEVKTYAKEDWKEAVLDFFDERGRAGMEDFDPGFRMRAAKEALFRSYDSDLGTFLQLPWKGRTGFAFSKYSYSLLSFEAKRLFYFADCYKKTEDEQLREWASNLAELFKNPDLYRSAEKGIYWCNMTHFDGSKLRGNSYLGVGFAGYPGGQGTISFNVGRYLKKENDPELRELLKKNLEFIISKQNRDGSWNAVVDEEFDFLNFMRNFQGKCEGATAENCRALIVGYEIFEDDRYLRSIEKGLSFLERENVICRNVLRDIGLNEPEGFSAILAANAFLEAYNLFGDERYLEYARTYICHLLTYFYWYGSLKGYFHPITESITPRISPFESLMAVKVFHRFSKMTGEKTWKKFRDMLFRRTLELVNTDGGLSEGVFIKYPEGFHGLGMEQTFATSELLHVCSIYGAYSSERKEREEIHIQETSDKIIVEDSVEINKDRFRIAANGQELDILMSDPYSFGSRIKTEANNILRRLAPLNSILDIGYVFKGVEPTRRKDELRSILPFIDSFSVKKNDVCVAAEAILPYHKVKCEIYKKDSDLKLNLIIDVRKHDVQCSKVTVSFGDYYDETIKTNWTQGGKYCREIDI